MCTCIFKNLLFLWEPFSPSHSITYGLKGLCLASPSEIAIHPGCMQSLYHSWMILEADSITSSSLWLWLALLKSIENYSTVEFICCQAKFFCWLRMQNFLCGQNRGMAGGSVASTHSSLWPQLFSGTIALSQILGWYQELTMIQDLMWNFLLLQRNAVCWVALTYEGSDLGSLGKITLPEPLLCVHDTDSCTWFHSLFTKSLSDFRFITPTVQVRKSSIEKKFAWSHLAF